MSSLTVHTHITNPFSSGYLAYLACVESWLRVADEVVVVDGGSTDRSLEILADWVGRDWERVRVVADDSTTWGSGKWWAWPQIAINRQAGLIAAHSDWALHVDADHVAADSLTRSGVATALAAAPKSGTAFDLMVGGDRPRTWLVRAGAEIAYGMDSSSDAGLDYPVHPTGVLEFIDPITMAMKRCPTGPPVRSCGSVDLDAMRYGHYFFDRSGALAKCKRIEEAIARYLGRSQAGPLLLQATNRLWWTRPTQIEHPDPIKRVLERYGTAGRLGSSEVVPIAKPLSAALVKGLSAVRAARTKQLRSRGLRGIRDVSGIVDVAALYAEQDRVFS